GCRLPLISAYQCLLIDSRYLPGV
ncbi:hypothetical protein CCACVL1_07989, partial [Corchorus capsularis]